MTDLSVIEQKKLMLEARVARKGAGRHLTIKSDLAEIETQTLKRRKVTDSKATSSMDEPQTSAQFVQEEVHQGSSKKLKNLMSDDICRTDLEITSLMKETREGHTSVEFKFWCNSFNGPRFFYDYLNTTKDVNKVKTIGRKKMTQNPNSYPMRCIILACGLFEFRDDYEKADSKLKDEITQLKDAQKTQSEKLPDLEKNLVEEKNRRETLESEGKASPS
ncbi:unnamed protein product [Vicia faba]|uniref:Uncharacterized protein n=1 Tax=Vicia faba TaxID=3906 RepID=A0AAV1B828_VICFA|nr:unnamed protein product [Vicia faba]